MSRSDRWTEFQRLYRAAFGEIELGTGSDWERAQVLGEWTRFAGDLRDGELRPLFRKVGDHWGRRGRPRLAAFWTVLKEMRGEGTPEYRRTDAPDAITFDQYLREYAGEDFPPGTGGRELVDFYRSRVRPRPRRDCGFWPIGELIGPGTGTRTTEQDVSSGEEVSIVAATSDEPELEDDDDVPF